MTSINIPCPYCADGFTTARDRHARTKQDVCPNCEGKAIAPARTGETPATSFDPPMTHSPNPTAMSRAAKLRRAAQALLDASILDFGLDDDDGDDEPVARGVNGGTAVTFGHLRRLQSTLRSHPATAIGKPGEGEVREALGVILHVADIPKHKRDDAEFLRGAMCCVKDYALAAFQALSALARPVAEEPGDAVEGEGRQTVPVKPTPEMLNAPLAQGSSITGARYESRRDLRPLIYAAMLAAAPKANGVGTGEEGCQTDKLVDRFAEALKAKLRAAEAKYGWRDGWMKPGWAEACQRDLSLHIVKGDPLDVAAYAAFCWHHEWPTYAPRVHGDRKTAAVVPTAAGEVAYQARYPGAPLGDCEDWAVDAWNRVAAAVLSTALAAKPEGEKASAVEDEKALCLRSARMFIGWPTAFKDRLDKADTNEALIACSEELADFLKRHRAQARAALTTATGSGGRAEVPKGWKLVPVEPSEDQAKAGTAALRAIELSTSMMFGGFNLPANVARHLAVAAWAAMLAAVPAALVDEEAGS